MKENEHKDIREIQDSIIDCAIKWAYEINQGNSKNANKQNLELNKLIFGFKDDKELSVRILVPLLQNSESSVRLVASAHTLAQGIDIQYSLQVLEDLANDYSTRAVSLMAYTILLKWKKDNDIS